MIDKPLYPLIMGNISGINDSALKVPTSNSRSIKNVSLGDPSLVTKQDSSDSCEISTHAVLTRSQTVKANKGTKSLKVLNENSSSVSREDLISLQKSDVSLARCFTKAQCSKKFPSGKGNYWFEVRDDLLVRCFKSSVINFGEMVVQVVLPETLRMEVLKLAHCGLLSGHQGTAKTFDRVTSSFHWPGIHGDVARFCQSCDACQQTVAKEKVTKVPLEKMPVIDVLFQVAVDLTDPVNPASNRKRR